MLVFYFYFYIVNVIYVAGGWICLNWVSDLTVILLELVFDNIFSIKADVTT